MKSLFNSISDIGLRFPHHIEYDKGGEHAAKLHRGLKILGPDFTAIICWWCKGTTYHCYEPCSVCGKGRNRWTGLGLLYYPSSEPAPESVVNQVLVAAERNLENAP